MRALIEWIRLLPKELALIRFDAICVFGGRAARSQRALVENLH